MRDPETVRSSVRENVSLLFAGLTVKETETVPVTATLVEADALPSMEDVALVKASESDTCNEFVTVGDNDTEGLRLRLFEDACVSVADCDDERWLDPVLDLVTFSSRVGVADTIKLDESVDDRVCVAVMVN